MYKITLWNRHSTNFGKNSFVRLNGTETFVIEIEANALACIMLAVRNPSIQKATMSGPQGCLSWTRNQSPIIDMADGCDYGYGKSRENFYYDDRDSDDCQE